MSVSTEVKKYADTARIQLSEQFVEARKPLLAVVGAGDVAVEQARELPGELSALRSRFEVLPEQVKALRGRVEETATSLGGSASSLYSELTVRGERVYSSLRRSETSPAAKAPTKARSKAGTATRKGASAEKKA
jgi:MoxR-like ATPase